MTDEKIRALAYEYQQLPETDTSRLAFKLALLVALDTDDYQRFNQELRKVFV